MTEPARDECQVCGLDGFFCRCPPVAPLTLREAVGKTPRILIDSREQSPLRFKDIETERCLLPCGDYSIRGLTADVAIERKSLADLTHCCGKDRPRFIEQIERMRSYRFRALVVEARHTDVSIGAFRSNINPKSVVGTLIKIAHELDVPVWYAEDADGASELVQQMLTREHRKARDRK